MHDEYNSIYVTTQLLFLGLGGIPHLQIVSIPVGANLPVLRQRIRNPFTRFAPGRAIF
jgi:hypothetical protein